MQIRTSRPIGPAIVMAASIAAILATSGCGGSSSTSTAPASATSAGATSAASSSAAVAGSSDSPALAAMLPDSIRSKGTITVAAAIYAPAVMTAANGTDITGWDIEITRKAAALLGLKVDFKIIPFDGVIPGLQAGRYDAATGEINVTADRTKVVTFVVNHVSRDEFIVRADSTHTAFNTANDVCGLTIGASLGSSEAAMANTIAGQCKDSGGKAVTVNTFATQAQVNLALSGGRIDADIASGSQAAYSVKTTNGQFKIAKMGFGPQIDTGLALPNNADTAKTAKAFQAATNELIKNGELKSILDNLNGGLGTITTSTIIPAPTS